MNSFITEFTELIHLTKQFIVQEYAPNQDEISTENERSAKPIAQKAKPTPPPVSPVSAQSPLLPVPEKSLPQTVTTIEIPAVLPNIQEKGAIELQLLKLPVKDIWNEMAALMETECPYLTLIKEIPDDSLAKNLRAPAKEASIETEVLLLSFQEPAKQLHLLKDIASAISICKRPAAVISALQVEQENGWEKLLANEKLKLVVASDYAIYGLPNLMKQYREASKSAEHFLGQVPLFLLADLSLYLREPLLKNSLWRALQRHIR